MSFESQIFNSQSNLTQKNLTSGTPICIEGMEKEQNLQMTKSTGFMLEFQQTNIRFQIDWSWIRNAQLVKWRKTAGGIWHTESVCHQIFYLAGLRKLQSFIYHDSKLQDFELENCITWKQLFFGDFGSIRFPRFLNLVTPCQMLTAIPSFCWTSFHESWISHFGCVNVSYITFCVHSTLHAMRYLWLCSEGTQFLHVTIWS